MTRPFFARNARRRNRGGGFRFAVAGIAAMLREEPNARVHLLAVCVVIPTGLVLRITAGDWRWLLLSIGIVLAAEAFNTGLERACDAVHPSDHPLIKTAKDAAAGGVLIAALASAAIGGLTLYPYVFRGSAEFVVAPTKH